MNSRQVYTTSISFKFYHFWIFFVKFGVMKVDSIVI